MEITHIDEHLGCEYYDTSMNAAIELLECTAGERRKGRLSESEIVFVMKGNLKVSYGKFNDIEIFEGQGFLLPAQSQCRVYFQDDSRLLIYRFKLMTQLCETYSLDFLKEDSPDLLEDFGILEVRDQLKCFLDLQQTLLENGVRCKMLMELKLKELFYLLRVYYTKQQLAGFFYPILSQDLAFSSMVLNNFMHTKSLQQLADLCNYSLSGFIKRFNRTFGMSPYKWVKQQKANLIFHELKERKKPLKEICREYGFSSTSYFHTFCKHEFGMTPSQIRNKA